MATLAQAWARLLGRDEATLSFELKEHVTLHMYEEALRRLGLDPEITPTSAYVKAHMELDWDDAQRFLDIVLKDGHGFDLKADFSRSGAEEFVGTVAAFFLTEQLSPSRTPMPWDSGFLPDLRSAKSLLKKLQKSETSASTSGGPV